MISRRRQFTSRLSRESLLSPRSEALADNPTPRSLSASLNLSTAEETPRDNLAVSWPITPRTNSTVLRDTPRGPTEAFSPRSPSPAEVLPVTPPVSSPEPNVLSPHTDRSEGSVTLGSESTSPGPSDERLPTIQSPGSILQEEEIPAMDLSMPEQVARLASPDVLSPRSAPYLATPASSALHPHQYNMSTMSLSSLPPDRRECELDLDASMRSTTSFGSMASVTSFRTPSPTARSPAPTARTPRGGFIWRPVKPGYTAPEPPTSGSSVVIKRTLEVQQTVTDVESQSTLKDSIPYMPKPVAIMCFILNILFPGLGTLLSGISVMCCAKPRPKNIDKWNSVLINSWVALLQLLTTFLFLLGWIWSIMWGAAFVQISVEEKSNFNKSLTSASEGADNLAMCRSETSLTDDTSHVAHRMRSRAISSSLTTATATTTISCEAEGDGPDPHPIIVLQEAPLMVQPGEMDMVIPPPSVPRSQRTLNRYNPRHQRALRRQNTEDDLPPIVLTPETLESIVIHNAPTMPGGVEGSGEEAGNPGALSYTQRGYANPKAGSSRSTPAS